MKRKTILAVIFLAICGCGTPTVKPSPCPDNTGVRIFLPDGTLGAVICCQHKADCYKQGHALCNTYDITQADNESSSQFKTGDSVVEYTIHCNK